METTPLEKVDKFKQHWAAAFGKIWNNYKEQDLYCEFAAASDIRLIVDAIWYIRERQKTANLGDLRNTYKIMDRKRKASEMLDKKTDGREPCDVCDNTGMAWCIYLEEADLCPCDCSWGSMQNDNHFGKDMPFTMVAERLNEMHRLGSFKTRDEAKVFLANWLKRQERESGS